MIRRLVYWLHGNAPWFISDAAWWLYFKTPGRRSFQ